MPTRERFLSNIGQIVKKYCDVRGLKPNNPCSHTLTLHSAHVVPKRAPTPAVRPMANAPHNVTRIAPTVTRAPPTRAAKPPKSARNSSDVPETTGIRAVSGTKAAVKRGIAAPTAKLPADASAA